MVYTRITSDVILACEGFRELSKTGKEFTFKESSINRRERDRKRFQKQNEESLMFEFSGLNNVQYLIKKRRKVFIDNYPCSIVNVELFCNKAETHWCSFDYQFHD